MKRVSEAMGLALEPAWSLLRHVSEPLGAVGEGPKEPDRREWWLGRLLESLGGSGERRIQDSNVPEASRRRWIDRNSALEGSGRRWSYKNSVLEGSRRRWIDKNSVLEGCKRRWNYKSSVLEGSRRRWNYRNSGFSDPVERHAGLRRCQRLLSRTPPNHTFSI